MLVPCLDRSLFGPSSVDTITSVSMTCAGAVGSVKCFHWCGYDEMTLSEDIEDCAIRLNGMSQVSSYWSRKIIKWYMHCIIMACAAPRALVLPLNYQKHETWRLTHRSIHRPLTWTAIALIIPPFHTIPTAKSMGGLGGWVVVLMLKGVRLLKMAGLYEFGWLYWGATGILYQYFMYIAKQSRSILRSLGP